jgi:hypothetical protein
MAVTISGLGVSRVQQGHTAVYPYRQYLDLEPAYLNPIRAV